MAIILMSQLALGVQIIIPQHVQWGIAFLLLILALEKNSFKVFVNPVTRFIGQISFSMYLVHFAILHFMETFDLINFHEIGIINFGLRYIMLTALSICVSWFFYRAIELPFQNLGRRIIQKMESTQY
jgi:peptidoglycan/LPS O-acetylase OafA/YrhL